MAVEGHEPVKRKVSAVLCRWSTNFAPASILLVCSMLVQQCFTGVVGTRFQPDFLGNPFKSEHYSLAMAIVTVMAEIDVFVSSTDNFNIIVVDGA